ncbi:MAG: hypothetical protein JJU30_13295 [Alkalimonas sp.]|nr:hypothetical protein [Alkalimonas sp.]
MIQSDCRMDDVVSAYIGLIDLYGDIQVPNNKTDRDYVELTTKATEFLIKSLAQVSQDEKLDFCLKASAWLGLQQLDFMDTLVREVCHSEPQGVHGIRSSFMRGYNPSNLSVG